MAPSVGVQFERDCALIDTKAHCDEYGDDVLFHLREEAQVSRGRLGSIKGESGSTDKTIKAFPVEYAPDKHRLERAGLFEEAEVAVWTPALSWTQEGVAFEDIDLRRATVEVGGHVYSIGQKSRASQFADTHLYWTFGLVRK